ncbi:MAG: adenosylhomocysteinase [Thermoplasmata archaeon]|nr:adenosylhomocysteinase [Thermoplasmata archaeon]
MPKAASLLPPSSPDLLEEGVRRIAWARTHMQVLAAIRSRFEEEQPFEGLRIGMALHVEAKTANLALALQAGGADVRLAGCNPESTDDRVVLALNGHHELPTTAKKGQDRSEYYASLDWVLDHKPHLVIDDGGDLGFLAHTKRKDALKALKGGAEETTTGVMRFKAMAAEGKLKFPVLNVNDAQMKHLFDNRYGTGQSTFDGLLHATNLLIAGKDIVVAGYGWCGKGIAMRAKGLGATVTVTEIDPVKAIEARLDGFQVAPMVEACRTADFILTATGCADVVDARHVPHLKDGVVLANAGHFNNEVSIPALKQAAKSVSTVRAGVTAYLQRDGRTLYLVADGRLVNLASGQGHPVEIMDMSFAIQALGMEHLAKNHASLEPGVHEMPAHIDAEVATLKLATLGLRIDALTPAQKAYLSTWEHGT